MPDDEDEEDPRTCILTGEPGENPDDCTTHSHEMRIYVVTSELGERRWHAEDADHAREQHDDAFPDEPILGTAGDSAAYGQGVSKCQQ